MLLPEMTPATQRAVLASLAWKKALSAGEVTAEHILVGLLQDEDARPAQLLTEQKVSLSSMVKQFKFEATALEMDEAIPAKLDSYLQKLLYDARHVAIESTGSPEVHSEHLLLALIKDATPLRQQLESLGFQAKLLQDRMITNQPADLQMDEPLTLIDSKESVSIARILDANVNRAKEALRVLEELCRFHLNDQYLTQMAKELRHDITQVVLHYLPSPNLLRSRDTEHDIGTQISTSGELHRSSLAEVQSANAQRLQEALRSLEEYGKVLSTEFGRRIERIRYRSYTLEKALLKQHHAKERLSQASLYLLVSKGSCVASIEWTIQEAAAGGVGIVQLREKNKGDRDLLAIGKEVRAATRKAGVLFVMNDRPDLARLTDADGVHLGQDDLDISSARNILGTDAIIGVSTHNIDQCKRAILDGADYLGVGPTFPSQTKSFTDIAGLDYVRQVAELTTLPSYAIGGINTENCHKVVQAGLRRAAVGQSISLAEEPRKAARLIKQQLTVVLKPQG